MNRVFLFSCIVILGCLVASLSTWGQSAEPAAEAKTAWEYKTFQRTTYSGGLDEQMNKLGSQGWEYCGAHTTTMSPDDVPTPTTVYVFRRAKPPGK
jgi:hypothetical protein